MVRLKDDIDKLSRYFTGQIKNPKAATLFFKALVCFTLIKIIVQWQLTWQVLAHHQISLPRSWFGKVLLAPAFLANYNVGLFFIVTFAFLVIALFNRMHYLITICFFWLTLSLYVVFLPFANGADLLLFMLALWCIPLPMNPKITTEFGGVIQRTSYHMGVLLCQLQVAFIYLISGWDKLRSETWRSGEAFDYIVHLNTMYNPGLSGLFESTLTHRILSWSTIVYELSFVIFVWIKRTRLITLAIGVAFHLFIWIVLSLPDFAIIMMLSYIIFLKDTDFTRKPKI